MIELRADTAADRIMSRAASAWRVEWRRPLGKVEINLTPQEKTLIEERIVDVLKTVYDPEIPVDIWNLGMIYKIDVKDDASVDVDMTFTAPSCPAADFILEDVRTKIESVEGVKAVTVNLVFEPMWDQSMMSEEARVELGFD